MTATGSSQTVRQVGVTISVSRAHSPDLRPVAFSAGWRVGLNNKLGRRMRSIFAKLFALPTPTREQVDAVARARFGPCPLCGRALTGHQLALLGSALVSGEESESTRLLREAVDKRKWSAAASIREWRGDSDELEFHALRCPQDARVALFKVNSYAEMWANDEVGKAIILDETGSSELLGTTLLEWRSL